MTEYVWRTLRAHAIETFGGDAPRAELEQRILDIFEQSPALVAKAINKIGHKYKAGLVRSPWAVLIVDIEAASTPGANITVTDTAHRSKKIAAAEQWIRAAGIHYDRETEIQQDLAGGLLKDYTDDNALFAQMLELWRQERPRGERTETEALERAEAWKQVQAHLKATVAAQAKPPPEDVPL